MSDVKVKAVTQSFDPLSILLVIHSYPPVLGGSEIEAQRVCRALRERGHKVRVLCAANPEMPQSGEWIDPYGTPVRVMGWGSGRMLDLSFACGVAERLVAERNAYDSVYFLMQGAHLTLGLPVAKLLNKPVVMKFSGSGIIPKMSHSFSGRWQIDRLKHWALKVLILNEGMREEARAAAIPERLLEWMPNPVDVTEFQPPVDAADKQASRKGLSLDPSDKIVLYVGRLAPEKELESLIRASYELPQPARLILVGDGPSAPGLRSLAQSLGARVDFAGRQPMEKVREYLKAADVFALVSSLEGFPCSLIEAMASGLPSVVSRIPANIQLIRNGEHGSFAEVGDSKGIALALSKLLSDDSLRQSMGSASRQVVIENYSSSSIADRYERLFRTAEHNSYQRSSVAPQE